MPSFRSLSAFATPLLLGVVLFAIEGCPANGSSSDQTPGCKSGVRGQCVADVAVGASFACAVLDDRTVWCWGKNDQGQLGYATTDLCPEDVGGGATKSFACHTFPFQVQGLPPATAIATGDAFACALAEDGTVRCWGSDTAGELGNGATVTSQTPVVVASLANVDALALGARHACALMQGHVSCWGADDRRQLGSEIGAPIFPLDAGSDGSEAGTDDEAGAIDASPPGTDTTCTVNGDAIACATRPVPVPMLSNVVAIAAGTSHTCALLGDGTVECWGDNAWGQLGIGVAGDVTAAGIVHVAVDAPLTRVLAISSGANHTCALRDGGDVYCWGRDDHDELGAPPPASGPMGCVSGACSAIAVLVPGVPSAIPAVDAGVADAGDDAAIDETGSDDGDVADARPAHEAAVDAGPMLGGFDRDVAAGDSFACVRLADGTARCWGADSVGQLGDGETTNDPRGATLVIGTPGAASDNPLQGVVKVRAGASSACVVMHDESLRCWGANRDGALGVGNFEPHEGPVPVSW